jgi:hypothetical protein
LLRARPSASRGADEVLEVRCVVCVLKSQGGSTAAAEKAGNDGCLRCRRSEPPGAAAVPGRPFRRVELGIRWFWPVRLAA